MPDEDPSDWDDDFDEDEFLAEWAAADRHAETVLRAAVPEVLDSEPPMDDVASAADGIRAEIAARTEEGRYFVKAAGWKKTPPEVDLQLWLQAAGSTIEPYDDPGTDPELQAAVGSMMHADWLALVVGLVRRGVGAEFSGELVVRDLLAMPEIDVDEVPEPNEYDLAVEVLVPLWQALGVIDLDRRLTPLGWWGLPRVLSLVWTTS